jgi:hypothetical protein
MNLFRRMPHATALYVDWMLHKEDVPSSGQSQTLTRKISVRVTRPERLAGSKWSVVLRLRVLCNHTPAGLGQHASLRYLETMIAAMSLRGLLHRGVNLQPALNRPIAQSPYRPRRNTGAVISTVSGASRLCLN